MQRIHQGVLIDDLATRDANQVGAIFHLCQLLGADHVIRIPGVGHRHHHHVGLGQQRGEAIQTHQRLHIVRLDAGKGVHRQDAHIKGIGALGGRPTDAAKPDQAHGPIGELRQGASQLGEGPFVPLLPQDELPDAARKGQQHREHAFRQAIAVRPHGAGQQHVTGHQLGDRGVVIDARGRRLNPLELLCRQKDLPVDPAHVDVHVRQCLSQALPTWLVHKLHAGEFGTQLIQVTLKPHVVRTNQDLHPPHLR